MEEKLKKFNKNKFERNSKNDKFENESEIEGNVGYVERRLISVPSVTAEWETGSSK